MQTQALDKISLTVSDTEKSVRFFTEVLPFKKEKSHEIKGETARTLYGLKEQMPSVLITELSLQNERIDLLEFAGVMPGRAIPSGSQSNDLWFQHAALVVRDMPKAYAKIKDLVTHISPAPQTLPEYLEGAAGISAFYFQDPDGHVLELIHFPKDKAGNWEATEGDPLFLGIDHTAVGISDTAQSRAFYEEILGLQHRGGSVNYGEEQEKLTAVKDAKIQINAFGAETGMKVEFLDYLQPHTGRSFPGGSSPQDLWHWQMHLRVSDLAAAFGILQDKNARFISERITEIKAGKSGFLVRDPDGHAVLLHD